MMEREQSPPMTSSSLENRLSSLRTQSNALQRSLTQQLATSPSGQKLLHIGPSLSTIPPDLHLLITNLTPLLDDLASYEEKCNLELNKIVESSDAIRSAERRAMHARDCALIYQDLLAGEREVSALQNPQASNDDLELELLSELERAALTTLHLVQELKNTQQASVTSSNSAESSSDTEKAHFLMKLAPRIRRLESDTIKCLTKRLENLLMKMQEDNASQTHVDLLSIGHCLRGLALLGRGKEAENAFARVAIMPLIRSKLSVGRLDQGGSRGQCAGLFSLLDDIACSIASTFGAVICLSEGIFNLNTLRLLNRDSEQDSSKLSNLNMEVDLVTGGVWMPIATALMAEPAIKMAIFSPGIADILQANYIALDVFLSELGRRLLKQTEEDAPTHHPEPDFENEFLPYYFVPTISPEIIESAQQRIYKHSITIEFSKKWNLPIYYQLRFQESSNRLNKAINTVMLQGWDSQVFTGDQETEFVLRKHGYELPLFLELYDVLLSLWQPGIILRPLTHRFLRGAIQLIARTVSFVKDGLSGKVTFGAEHESYLWMQNINNVAAVAWELTVLETSMIHDYAKTIYNVIAPQEDSITKERSNCLNEIRTIVLDALLEASQELSPIITQSWNEIIVQLLIRNCSTPLTAVKGVAATYRMTNRPPPSHASPFVTTILRPLKEFHDAFSCRTPPHIGATWKHHIIEVVSEHYSIAVDELLDTIKRTEEALKNRKARRATSGGMSDGEKVKLQLFLDFKEYERSVSQLNVHEPVTGLIKLEKLTMEGEGLWIERGGSNLL